MVMVQVLVVNPGSPIFAAGAGLGGPYVVRAQVGSSSYRVLGPEGAAQLDPLQRRHQRLTLCRRSLNNYRDHGARH